MRVRSLNLSCFRNYRELQLKPGAGLNILYGSNAQGKSNVLEAVSLLATSRSLRAGRESELILRDTEIAHVTAEVDRDREGEVELQVSVFQGDKKAVRINGMKRPRVIDLLGQFNAVFFGSIDLGIINGDPSVRRHYLNVEISQISPRYVYDLGHYKRIVEQRNRLLRDLRDRPRPPADSGLDAWNEQLVLHGSPILEKRRFYIDRLKPLADQIHRELTDGKEGLEVRYAPSFPLPESMVREMSREDQYVASVETDALQSEEAPTHPTPERRSPTEGETDAIANSFRAQLERVAFDEARRGTTLVGPQRDDLCFAINGAEARIYGSQGQQRTAALALKLAEFQLIEEYVGEPPVMLLDDVMSDLDDARRKHLLRWVQRRCQTFITCTNLRSFPREVLEEATTFHVVSGTVSPDVKAKPRSNPAAVEQPPASVKNEERGQEHAQPVPELPAARRKVEVEPAAELGRVGG